MIDFSEADRAIPQAFITGFFKDLWLVGTVVTLPVFDFQYEARSSGISGHQPDAG